MPDLDPTKEPIVVTSAQGATDALQALGRYVFVIFSVMSGFFAVIGTHDATKIATFFQQNVGPLVTAVFGLVGICTAAWGIYKSYKRGAQLATAAAEPDHVVSNRVLRLSDDPKGQPLNSRRR